jgi:NAD(P)-dependent dehydrogenase (short-subunit alcohol dehydrogenase family)
MSENKIALVTGANRGIGFEISRQLANKGFTVIVGARNEEKGRESAAKLKAENLDIDVVQIDSNDAESIKRAAEIVGEKYGKLDALINNAGIFVDFGTPPSQTDLQILRQTFETNVFGVWETIQAFLPLLKKSDAGRIVNVSSTVGSLAEIGKANSMYAQMIVPAYQASKTAVNAITRVFAKELQDTNIKINSVCPGYVNSNPPYTDGAPKSTEEGARISVKMATIGNDGESGGFFDDDGRIAW